MDTNGRKRIGILFNFDRSWLGGVYYLINIIKSLNYLEEENKPEIILFYNKNLADFVDKIEYPYLKPVLWEFPSVYKGYLKSILLQKNIFVDEILNQYKLVGIYPVNDQPVFSKKAQKNNIQLVAWFADLQHKFFPEFFSKKKLLLRETKLRLLLKNTSNLVVSSNDVESHFNKFYTIRKDLSIKVLPFVSIIDNFNFNNIDELKIKYKLPDAYFMVSNQFYKHKNHIIVLKALSELVKKGNKEVFIVMTGKMDHYNNPEFITQLRQEISTNQLTPFLGMLDVIPREEQLCLMKHAKAVIQPSLFEGWSTVIEDAKSLQIPVIASDIAIHKEQLEEKGFYFNPKKPNELALYLTSFQRDDSEQIYEEYTQRVQRFAEKFIKLFSA